ncbi:MAG: hypothetical protein LBL94_06440 [Prevotellaceae bacterium]|jgi:hypothetical protein|nr:hypothetical protein [Prevotellaceae bacterium]
MKKYKGVTQLSLEYSGKIITEVVDISSLDARRLVAKAYCAGYECARRRDFRRRISKVSEP